MYDVRCRQVQDEQRECRVYRLCGRDLVWCSRCDRRKCVHILRRGRRLTSRELGFRGVCIRLCCREHGVSWFMYVVRRREIQDECRERRVHGLRTGDVLGCGRGVGGCDVCRLSGQLVLGRCRGECFRDVFCMSWQLQFTVRKCDTRCLCLLRRVHRRKRRDMSALRA